MFYRVLAIVLSLSLMVPVGGAADRAGQSARTDADVTEVRETQGPVSRTTSPRQKAPEPLSAEEDVSLAARTEEPGPEVAGGALSNLHLTYAVIALAAIVLVLVLK